MGEAESYQQYEVLKREDGSLWELWRGGMGVTYKAYDTKLRRVVALKVINGVYLSSDMARQRFLREARAAAALQHQNVASIFNLGTNLGEYFYVMEFIDGETLDAYVRRKGPLELTEALNISIQVSRALDAAAQQHLTRNSAHRPGTTWKHTSSRSSAAPAYRVGASRTQGKSHRFFAIGT